MNAPKHLGLLLLASLLAVGACTCGDSNGDPDGGPDSGVPPEVIEGLRSLTLSPDDVTLTVVGDVPATQAFKVTGHFANDKQKDLTQYAEFFLDDARLGTFSGPDYTSSIIVGGITTVRASVATFSAEGRLEVQLKKTATDGDPTLPSNPGSFFGGTVDPARAPTLVYPNDGVMLPPNLGGIEIHFRKVNNANTLFELAFSGPQTDARVYVRCSMPNGVLRPFDAPDGCIYQMNPQVWTWLAESNRGGGALTLVVRATDDSGTGAVGVSAPLSIQIARADLQGGLYYWTTTDSRVMRFDFASRASSAPSLAVDRAQANHGCVGCHSLSRSGKTLVASVGGQNPPGVSDQGGKVLLYDVATDTAKVPFGTIAERSQFFAWNQDGTEYVGVYGDSGATDYGVMRFDGNTGVKLGSIPSTGTAEFPATHPDWSPDGEHVVYVRQGKREVLDPMQHFNTNQRFGKGSIRMVSRTGAGWSAPITVVPEASGRNRYYPAVAPDSQYLVFNESNCPIGELHRWCNADTDPDASLWVAPLQANATMTALTRANTGGVMDGAVTSLSNSFPRWNPFEVRGNAGSDSRLHWLTFSSTRRYGLRMPPEGGIENPKGTLLWMSAVDPADVAAGRDGSAPAFVLPIQDVRTSNHVAQWAQYAVVDQCSVAGEGCQIGGATCCNGLTCTSVSENPVLPCDQAGNCACRPTVACGISGEACSASSPCCGGLACQGPGGGACTGADCVCQPSCGAIGQGCGDGFGPCCGGLLCIGTSGGACSGGACACQLVID